MSAHSQCDYLQLDDLLVRRVGGVGAETSGRDQLLRTLRMPDDIIWNSWPFRPNSGTSVRRHSTCGFWDDGEAEELSP